MPVSPKDGFDVGIERSEHLLLLYSLLKNTRSRAVRTDWARRFNTLMNWPVGEKIVRIDGANRNSILIVRESVGLSTERFAHNYCCELLRASVVAAVSALDRYCHDLIVKRSWMLLSRREGEIPAELKKISIPVVTTKRALEKLRSDNRARPGSLVKQAIQEQLHREFTFQKPDSIATGAKMLGITDFWTKVAAKMPGRPGKAEVIEKLKRIADRRNQIVHEADVIRQTRARKHTSRDLSEKEARDFVAWIKHLVEAVDAVVAL